MEALLDCSGEQSKPRVTRTPIRAVDKAPSWPGATPDRLGKLGVFIRASSLPVSSSPPFRKRNHQQNDFCSKSFPCCIPRCLPAAWAPQKWDCGKQKITKKKLKIKKKKQPTGKYWAEPRLEICPGGSSNNNPCYLLGVNYHLIISCRLNHHKVSCGVGIKA